MLPGYTRVLEIGFGGNPFGIANWHPEGGIHLSPQQKLDLFSRYLPDGVDYFGIDFPPRKVQRSGRWVVMDDVEGAE